MKKILVSLFCLFFSLVSFAESVDNFIIKDGNVIITEVVKVEGKSQNAIYKDALIWVNEVFNNPKTVVQTKEVDLGLITLKTIVIISNDYDGKPSQWYNINLSIQAKDGRYKYEISDIVYNFDLSDIGEFIKKTLDGNNDGEMKKAREVFTPVINTLKNRLSKAEEDW